VLTHSWTVNHCFRVLSIGVFYLACFRTPLLHRLAWSIWRLQKIIKVPSWWSLWLRTFWWLIHYVDLLDWVLVLNWISAIIQLGRFISSVDSAHRSSWARIGIVRSIPVLSPFISDIDLILYVRPLLLMANILSGSQSGPRLRKCVKISFYWLLSLLFAHTIWFLKLSQSIHVNCTFSVPKGLASEFI